MLNPNSTTELHPPQEVIYLSHALVPSSIKPGWCSHLPSQGQTLGQHIQNVTTSSTHISPHWNVNGHKVGTWLYSQWHLKGLTFCLELLNESQTLQVFINWQVRVETETDLDCLALVLSESSPSTWPLKWLKAAMAISWWYTWNFL